MADVLPDHANAAVVIPCIEIEKLTIRCVDECRRLFPSAEIIVLPDVPAGADLIREKARIVVTGLATIPAKRNRGAQETEKPVIAFIDSDAFPEAGWLDNAVRALKDNPTVGAVAGPNVPPPQQSLSERYVGIALQSEFCAHNASYVKRPAPSRLVENMPSSNLIVRRDEYLAMGGMDERYNGGEDVEFCRRLVKSGRRILYLPDVLVYHKNRRFSQFVLQRFVYGINDMASVLKSPALMNVKALIPMGFVLFVFTGLVLPWFPLWYWVYLPVLAAYLAILTYEAFRFSRKFSEVPGALAAMIVATVAPGVGALAKVFGFRLNSQKIYRNDR